MWQEVRWKMRPAVAARAAVLSRWQDSMIRNARRAQKTIDNPARYGTLSQYKHRINERLLRGRQPLTTFTALGLPLTGYTQYVRHVTNDRRTHESRMIPASGACRLSTQNHQLPSERRHMTTSQRRTHKHFDSYGRSDTARNNQEA